MANEGCLCTPGTTSDCYTGPTGTMGVGLCHAGTHVCAADGESYGPCTGEVVPAPEDCATPEDEDCDGEVNQPAAGCVCAPLGTASCYSGPSGTEGVGACMAGVKTCDAQGTSWSACVGETTPSPELCGTAADENCDGAVNEGCAVWARRYGDAADQIGNAIAADASGIVITGTTFGGIDFGGGVLSPTPGSSHSAMFVAKLDTSGNHVWSKAFGELSTNGQAAAVDGTGGIAVAGFYSGTIDFGGGPLPASPAVRGVVARLGPAGEHQWSFALMGTGNASALAVAFDAAGDVFLGGSFHGTVDFGGGPITAATGGSNNDGYIAKYDPWGNLLWVRQFSAPPDNLGNYNGVLALAVDPSGAVLATGKFRGPIDFGGGPITGSGVYDAFLVKLDAAGNHVWSKSFGVQSEHLGAGVGTDAAGNVVVVGEMWGTMDFGGGPITSNGGNDIFTAKLDPNGDHIWSKTFGGAGNDVGEYVSITPQGEVLVTGLFKTSADFGCGVQLASGTKQSIFATKLDGNGKCVWSRNFVNASSQYGRAIASSPSGSALLAGRFVGTVDFGTGPLTSAGNSDLYVIELAP